MTKTEAQTDTAARQWLVSTVWLADHLDAPDVLVLDASYYLPTAGRDPDADYLSARIPGAVRFDIDKVADPDAPLAHTMPSPTVFAAQVRRLGIGDGMQIVIYDTAGLFSAARAWWMFRVMGHDDVRVLDGGLAKWQAEGRPVEDGPATARQPRHFTPKHRPGMIADLNHVRQTIESKSAQIVDARSAERFSGEAEDPHGELRTGHMPGAANVPYATLLNPDRTMKSDRELREIFSAAGVNGSKPIITSCGSGVTAAIVTLALAEIGIDTGRLYDGSWTEWGRRDDVPVATGTP
ncbi:MAG: 3-mercaptopyruvate sulfurtransferase [Pseudomonadota bacterium]